MKLLARGLWALLTLTLLVGVATVGVLWHEGYRAYVVHTGSMTGTYDTGDLVIDKPVTAPLRVGQVITFRHSAFTTDVVTHRVVSLKNGAIQTKGDANPTPDVWNIPHSFVKGIVATSIPNGGYVVYFFKQRAGDAAAMTGLLALILLYGLFFGSSSDVKKPERRADDMDGNGPDLDSLPPFAQAIERLRRGHSLATLAGVDASANSSL